MDSAVTAESCTAKQPHPLAIEGWLKKCSCKTAGCASYIYFSTSGCFFPQVGTCNRCCGKKP